MYLAILSNLGTNKLEKFIIDLEDPWNIKDVFNSWYRHSWAIEAFFEKWNVIKW